MLTCTSLVFNLFIFYFPYRHSPSNLSGISPFDGSCCGANSSYNDLSSGESSVAEDIPKYRVVLLGDSGVGKTALVSQFMTSEYMNTYDASLGMYTNFKGNYF